MTEDQIEAFNEGAGSELTDFTVASLYQMFQLIGSTALFVFLAWLCYTAYKDYGEGQITAGSMMIVWGRGILMMTFLLYIILHF